MDVRSRNVYEKLYTSSYRIYPDWTPWTDSIRLTGRQRTVSEGHPISRIGKSGEDIGGNFQTERWYAPKPAVLELVNDQVYGHRRREGPIWTSMPHRMFRFDNGDPSEGEWAANSHCAHVDLLHQRGTTAIAHTIPTNPAFSAAAAIGELREGPPGIPGKSTLLAKGRPKGIADDYLNWQFGIAPTVNDLKKLAKAHKESEKILAQLYRDSGRLVRRRFSFPPEIEESEYSQSGVYPWGSYVDSYNFAPGTLTVRTVKERKFWFKGGYTYFFPKQEGWHRKVAELEKVYGVIPDAADIYQLTPWSWAVDWVSNTGDLVQNLTSFSQDGLVLRFGYIMCHTTVKVTETWNGLAAYEGLAKPLRLTCQWRYESKQRQKATPYGFGLDTDGFNTRQKAIIAALGISKASR